MDLTAGYNIVSPISDSAKMLKNFFIKHPLRDINMFQSRCYQTNNLYGLPWHMYRCRGEEEDTFQGNRGKLGVYRGNCQPQCQGGGGSGGNQSICQVGGNEEIPHKQEKGDVWRNGGYKIKRDVTFSPWKRQKTKRKDWKIYSTLDGCAKWAFEEGKQDKGYRDRENRIKGTGVEKTG